MGDDKMKQLLLLFTYCKLGEHVVDKIVRLALGGMMFTWSSVNIVLGRCGGGLVQSCKRSNQQRARHDVLQFASQLGGVRLFVRVGMGMLDLVEKGLLAERGAKGDTLLKDRFAEGVGSGEGVVGVGAGGC